MSTKIHTLRLKQNGRQVANNILKFILIYVNCYIEKFDEIFCLCVENFSSIIVCFTGLKEAYKTEQYLKSERHTTVAAADFSTVVVSMPSTYVTHIVL